MQGNPVSKDLRPFLLLKRLWEWRRMTMSHGASVNLLGWWFSVTQKHQLQEVILVKSPTLRPFIVKPLDAFWGSHKRRNRRPTACRNETFLLPVETTTTLSNHDFPGIWPTNGGFSISMLAFWKVNCLSACLMVFHPHFNWAFHHSGGTSLVENYRYLGVTPLQ